MAKARGRPSTPQVRSKDRGLDVRVESAEREAFKRAAEIAGLSVSAWVRVRLRAAARKELKDAGEPVPFLESRSKPEVDS